MFLEIPWKQKRLLQDQTEEEKLGVEEELEVERIKSQALPKK